MALLDAAEVQELDAENFVTALKVGYDAWHRLVGGLDSR